MALICAFLAEPAAYAAPDLPIKKINIFASPKISLDVPQSVAAVGDRWMAPDSKLIVYLIQDPHTNYSGQINVARILESLFAQERLEYVFLEAGYGDESLSSARAFAQGLSGRHQLEAMVRENRLQGPELFDLTTAQPVKLWGVENMALYYRAIEAYRRVIQGREKFQGYLARIRQTIDALKPRIMNPALARFDAIHKAFIHQEMTLTDYAEALSQQAAKQSIPMQYYTNLNLLETLRQKERAIDFVQANQEQADALASLTEADRAEILSGGATGKSPVKVSHDADKTEQAYYAALKSKIDLKRYPALRAYVEYMELARTVEAKGVLHDIDSLSEAVYSRLAGTSDEAALTAVDRMQRLMKKLFDLTLTPEEYAAYLKLRPAYDLVEITGFLNRKIMDMKSLYERADHLEEGHAEYLKACEHFYELTFERDRAMVENMKAVTTDSAVLITGGFHTPNLKHLLKESGISYVVITPQVLTETNVAKYETALLGQIDTLMQAPSTRFARSGQAHSATANLPRIFRGETLGKLGADDPSLLSRLKQHDLRMLALMLGMPVIEKQEAGNRKQDGARLANVDLPKHNLLASIEKEGDHAYIQVIRKNNSPIGPEFIVPIAADETLIDLTNRLSEAIQRLIDQREWNIGSSVTYTNLAELVRQEMLSGSRLAGEINLHQGQTRYISDSVGIVYFSRVGPGEVDDIRLPGVYVGIQSPQKNVMNNEEFDQHVDVYRGESEIPTRNLNEILKRNTKLRSRFQERGLPLSGYHDVYLLRRGDQIVIGNRTTKYENIVLEVNEFDEDILRLDGYFPRTSAARLAIKSDIPTSKRQPYEFRTKLDQMGLEIGIPLGTGGSNTFDVIRPYGDVTEYDRQILEEFGLQLESVRRDPSETLRFRVTDPSGRVYLFVLNRLYVGDAARLASARPIGPIQISDITPPAKRATAANWLFHAVIESLVEDYGSLSAEIKVTLGRASHADYDVIFINPGVELAEVALNDFAETITDEYFEAVVRDEEAYFEFKSHYPEFAGGDFEFKTPQPLYLASGEKLNVKIIRVGDRWVDGARLAKHEVMLDPNGDQATVNLNSTTRGILLKVTQPDSRDTVLSAAISYEANPYNGDPKSLLIDGHRFELDKPIEIRFNGYGKTIDFVQNKNKKFQLPDVLASHLRDLAINLNPASFIRSAQPEIRLRVVNSSVSSIVKLEYTTAARLALSEAERREVIAQIQDANHDIESLRRQLRKTIGDDYWTKHSQIQELTQRVSVLRSRLAAVPSASRLSEFSERETKLLTAAWLYQSGFEPQAISVISMEGSLNPSRSLVRKGEILVNGARDLPQLLQMVSDDLSVIDPDSLQWAADYANTLGKDYYKAVLNGLEQKLSLGSRLASLGRDKAELVTTNDRDEVDIYNSARQITHRANLGNVHQTGGLHSAITIIPVDPDGNVVFIHRPKDRTRYPNTLDFFNNHVRAGNSFRDAAIAKLNETIYPVLDPNRLIRVGSESSFRISTKDDNVHDKAGRPIHYKNEEIRTVYVLPLTAEEVKAIRAKNEEINRYWKAHEGHRKQIIHRKMDDLVNEFFPGRTVEELEGNEYNFLEIKAKRYLESAGVYVFRPLDDAINDYYKKPEQFADGFSGFFNKAEYLQIIKDHIAAVRSQNFRHLKEIYERAGINQEAFIERVHAEADLTGRTFSQVIMGEYPTSPDGLDSSNLKRKRKDGLSVPAVYPSFDDAVQTIERRNRAGYFGLGGGGGFADAMSDFLFADIPSVGKKSASSPGTDNGGGSGTMARRVQPLLGYIYGVGDNAQLFSKMLRENAFRHVFDLRIGKEHDAKTTMTEMIVGELSKSVDIKDSHYDETIDFTIVSPNRGPIAFLANLLNVCRIIDEDILAAQPDFHQPGVSSGIIGNSVRNLYALAVCYKTRVFNLSHTTRPVDYAQSERQFVVAMYVMAKMLGLDADASDVLNLAVSSIQPATLYARYAQGVDWTLPNNKKIASKHHDVGDPRVVVGQEAIDNLDLYGNSNTPTNHIVDFGIASLDTDGNPVVSLDSDGNAVFEETPAASMLSLIYLSQADILSVGSGSTTSSLASQLHPEINEHILRRRFNMAVKDPIDASRKINLPRLAVIFIMNHAMMAETPGKSNREIFEVYERHLSKTSMISRELVQQMSIARYSVPDQFIVAVDPVSKNNTYYDKKKVEANKAAGKKGDAVYDGAFFVRFGDFFDYVIANEDLVTATARSLTEGIERGATNAYGDIPGTVYFGGSDNPLTIQGMPVYIAKAPNDLANPKLFLWDAEGKRFINPDDPTDTDFDPDMRDYAMEALKNDGRDPHAHFIRINTYLWYALKHPEILQAHSQTLFRERADQTVNSDTAEVLSLMMTTPQMKGPRTERGKFEYALFADNPATQYLVENGFNPNNIISKPTVRMVVKPSKVAGEKPERFPGHAQLSTYLLPIVVKEVRRGTAQRFNGKTGGARLAGLFKDSLSVKQLIQTIRRDWKQIQASGALVFDVDKTLLAKHADRYSNMNEPEYAELVETLLRLLRSGIRIAMISGNTDAQHLQRVYEPLRKAAAGDSLILRNLTMYTSGGNRKITFNAQGNSIDTHEYNTRNLINRDELTPAVEAIRAFASDKFGLTDAQIIEWKVISRNQKYGRMQFDMSWADGNTDWTPTLITDSEWIRIVREGGTVSWPLIEMRGVTEDGKMASFAIKPTPELDALDPRSELVGYLAETYGSERLIFRPGGTNSVDVTVTDKSTALLDYIHENQLDPRYVYYFGDEFGHFKDDILGNDEAIASHPDLQSVTTLAVNSAMPVDSNATDWIGNSYKATQDFLVQISGDAASAAGYLQTARQALDEVAGILRLARARNDSKELRISVGHLQEVIGLLKSSIDTLTQDTYSLSLVRMSLGTFESRIEDIHDYLLEIQREESILTATTLDIIADRLDRAVNQVGIVLRGARLGSPVTFDEKQAYFRALTLKTLERRISNRVTARLWIRAADGQVYTEQVAVPVSRFTISDDAKPMGEMIADYFANHINRYGVIVGATDVGIDVQDASGKTMNYEALREDVRRILQADYGKTVATASFGKGIKFFAGPVEALPRELPIDPAEITMDTSQLDGIGFDIGGTFLKWAVRINGQVQTYTKPMSDFKAKASLRRFIVSEVRKHMGKRARTIPVVITVPGPITPDHDIVHITNIDVTRPNTKAELETLRQQYPNIRYQNDANVAAIYVTEQAKVTGNSLVHTLGTGLGFAYLINGILGKGPMEAQVRVTSDPKAYYHDGFEMRGDIESYTNAEFLVRRAQELAKELHVDIRSDLEPKNVRLTFEEYLRLDKNDSRRKIAEKASREMGRNIFKLDLATAEITKIYEWTIILTGGLAKGNLVSGEIKRGIREAVQNAKRRLPGLKVKVLSFDEAEFSGALGALYLGAQAQILERGARLTDQRAHVNVSGLPVEVRINKPYDITSPSLNLASVQLIHNSPTGVETTTFNIIRPVSEKANDFAYRVAETISRIDFSGNPSVVFKSLPEKLQSLSAKPGQMLRDIQASLEEAADEARGRDDQQANVENVLDAETVDWSRGVDKPSDNFGARLSLLEASLGRSSLRQAKPRLEGTLSVRLREEILGSDVKLQAVRAFVVRFAEQFDEERFALTLDQGTAIFEIQENPTGLKLIVQGTELLVIDAKTQAQIKDTLSEVQREALAAKGEAFLIRKALTRVSELLPYQSNVAHDGYVHVNYETLAGLFNSQAEFDEAIQWSVELMRSHDSQNYYVSGLNRLNDSQINAVNALLSGRKGKFTTVRPDHKVLVELRFVADQVGSIQEAANERYVFASAKGLPNLALAYREAEIMAEIYSNPQFVDKTGAVKAGEEAAIVQALQDKGIVRAHNEFRSESTLISGQMIHNVATNPNQYRSLVSIVLLPPLVKFLEDRVQALRLMQEVLTFA